MACIAFILQIIIFKITTQRLTRYWILILTGLGILALSIPFTFALMVRLVILLIILIFFPEVLDYYFAGSFILFLSFLL